MTTLRMPAKMIAASTTALVLAAVGLLAITEWRNDGVDTSPGAGATGQVEQLVSLNSTYDGFSGLAADPQGGAWAFAESAGQLNLFHVTSSGTVKQYSAALPDSSYAAGGDTPTAVLTSGQVAVAVNRHLILLDPATSAWSFKNVPAPPLSSASPSTVQANAGSGSSPEGVSAIAVTSDGEVSLALTFADAAVLYNPSNDSFSSVQLPAGTEISMTDSAANELASTPGGFLADLWDGNSHVLYSHSGGAWTRISTGTCSPLAFATDSEQDVASAGENCLVNSSSLTAATPQWNLTRPRGSHQVAFAGAGQVLDFGPGTVTVIDATSGNQSGTITLGSTAMPSTISDPRASALASGPTESDNADLVAATGSSGVVYFIETASDHTLRSLTVG